MRKYLNGSWKFKFTEPKTNKIIKDFANVPGNVEPELVRLNFLDDYMPLEDPRKTDFLMAVDDWTFTTVFKGEDIDKNNDNFIVFEGIDCIAEIYLNGELVQNTNNTFLTYKINANGKLKDENELKVVIKSFEKYSRQFECECSDVNYYNSLLAHIRKPRYQIGWDNAPRLLSYGIVSDVYIESLPKERIHDTYIHTKKINNESVIVQAVTEFNIPYDEYIQNYQFRTTWYQNGKEFRYSENYLNSVRQISEFTFSLNDVKLWWPRGFGEPNLVEVKLELYKNGVKCHQINKKIGLCTIKLLHDPLILDDDDQFVFIVNGEKCYIKGTNWKPLNPLMSCRNKNMEKAFELMEELNCNMVRVWGGGYYEDEKFYDLCDEKGIMVWQDFMFACEYMPMDDEICKLVEKEAIQIIKKYRNHVSLAVWCGDNEVDCNAFYGDKFTDRWLMPSDNKITRNVLKNCVLRFCPHIEYLESSPLFVDELIKDRRNNPNYHAYSAEFHHYPDIFSFKDGARENDARFFGEAGPLYICAMSDNKNMIEYERPRFERLWDEKRPPSHFDNGYHQCDGYFLTWLNESRKVIKQWFDKEFGVNEIEDFGIAINIICSNFFKDFIELYRCKKWTKTGVIWWSLLDMWPMMFNYSVVDSEFHKKMQYYWIKQMQQDVCLMITSDEAYGKPELYIANDTLNEVKGSYKIYEVDGKGNRKQIYQGLFNQEANSSTKLGAVYSNNEKSLLVLEWEIDGKLHYNHFVTGWFKYDFEEYKLWCNILYDLYK